MSAHTLPFSPALPLLPFGVWRRASLFALSLASVACAAPTPPQANKADAAAATEVVWRRIEAELGDARCDGDSQCRSAPVGDKPCGGPERYLAWSTQRSDEARLNKLLAEHRALRHAENLKSEMMSNCQFIADPGARCIAQRCTLLPPGLGRAPGRAD